MGRTGSLQFLTWNIPSVRVAPSVKKLLDSSSKMLVQVHGSAGLLKERRAKNLAAYRVVRCVHGAAGLLKERSPKIKILHVG